MALPQSRRDSYGRPLPELTEARHELLVERPYNQAKRRELLARIEELLPQILRRGVHADVVVRFSVQDGLIQKEIDLGVTRHFRQQPEDE
jgi:hypothetical protein